jgi:hypothetical protein
LYFLPLPLCDADMSCSLLTEQAVSQKVVGKWQCIKRRDRSLYRTTASQSTCRLDSQQKRPEAFASDL